VQLMDKRQRRSFGVALGLAVSNLLGTVVHAQDAQPNIMTDPAPGVGTTTVDAAVLFYQESGGRVRAIEPTTSLTVNKTNGDVLTGSFTYDSLTGATPNGAMPSTSAQSFTMRIPAPSTQSTRTSASGNRTVVTIPGTGLVNSTYTAAANTLPVDPGFKDHRYAGSLGYSTLLGQDTRLKLGAAASVERDYRSYSGNIGISQDLNQKSTTLSLAANFEYDQSRPFYGTPTAFQPIGNVIAGRNDHKTVASLVAGVTQTITPWWVAQLNYSYGSNQGYQSDPYRFLTIENAGVPRDYVYESRPRSRTRQSVYFGNKISIGPTVADLSARYYHDSWGINAITAEVSERVPLTRALYIEPSFRYYHQSAANFFTYYLDAAGPTPTFASSDSRLSRFNATTIGLKLGYRVSDGIELYVAAEDYRQTGAHTIAGPGTIPTLDVFSGTHAISAMSGIRFKL
jgi:hypothetical protein